MEVISNEAIAFSDSQLDSIFGGFMETVEELNVRFVSASQVSELFSKFPEKFKSNLRFLRNASAATFAEESFCSFLRRDIAARLERVEYTHPRLFGLALQRIFEDAALHSLTSIDFSHSRIHA